MYVLARRIIYRKIDENIKVYIDNDVAKNGMINFDKCESSFNEQIMCARIHKDRQSDKESVQWKNVIDEEVIIITNIT